MQHYIFLMLRHGRGRSFLASSGFFFAACALILLSATTQTTILQAHQIISKNWRSTYDLVVLPSTQNALPPNSSTPPGVFEGYNGGISIQQYEQIKQLPGIAVAAPIAFVSYVSYPSIVILVGPDHLSHGFYQLDWTQSAFDGRQQVIEYHGMLRSYALNCPSSAGDGTAISVDNATYNALLRLGADSGAWCIQYGKYLVGIPDAGAFLLAAIDPEAENQLVHLDKALVSGRMLTPQDVLSPYADTGGISSTNGGQSVLGYGIPLLLNTQLAGQSNVHAEFAHLITNLTDPKEALAQGGSGYLDHLPRQTLFSSNVPLARNNFQFFSVEPYLDWNGHAWGHDPIGRTTPFFFTFTSLPSGLTYQQSTAPTGITNPAYSLVPRRTYDMTGTGKTVAAFRDLNPLPGTNISTGGQLNISIYNGAVYSADVVGQFAGQRIAAEFSNVLNWLPESTYLSSPTILRYDAQGHPLKPTTLLPTTNPVGFTVQPPLALTTLNAARKIVGDKLISVIRVRLSGNITPDDAGWQHVSQVAQEIHRRTGLRVIVTLGSSPQPTLVYIPGITKGQYGLDQSIAPLGWVEERWIAIGVGLVYLNQLGQTQVLFLGAILLVCLGYLTVTLSALVTAQRREMAVLSALGWEPLQPVISFLAQAFALALGGGIIGIGVALLIVALIGASPPWFIVAWTLPIILGLALLSASYPLWQLWRVQPAEVLREGSMISTSRNRRGQMGAWLSSHLPAVASMALSNLARSRLRTAIALGCLFLSAGLLTVMIDGLFVFRQTLQGTLLGNYVLFQTAVPQLAGAVVAILLTFLSVSDLLLLQVRERRKEIGLLQAVGWRPSIVQRLFVQEGMLLALAGTMPGVLVALGILSLQHQAQGSIPAPIVGLGAVLLMLLVSTLATLPAIQATRRIPLMDILRAE